MSKNSSIEWTHHTFNPWWGCAKVSPACDHCYAEAWAKRVGEQVWGSKAPRRTFSDHHWRSPISWNNEARDDGTRRRVFCASMADVFEPRKDLDKWRIRLWELIENTPNLDWLILTKRPDRVLGMVPWAHTWPGNVWVGTTAENQRYADKRVAALVEIPAVCRFLSCEPLLGGIDLAAWLPRTHTERVLKPGGSRSDSYVDWVIAGGESGPGARPMHPDWARDLRDQCSDSGVPFHFKQWGHWSPIESGNKTVRQQLIVESEDGSETVLGRLPKKKAGRSLDGRTWDGFPVIAFS